MVDLDKFNGRSSDKYVVRHTTDDSGDYTLHNYHVLAIMPYGPRTITESIDNPHDALMFAAAPEMISEIKELRAKVNELERRIQIASQELTSRL